MKTFKTLLAFIVIISATGIVNAQVGIGTITPQGALDITSTTDGLLIPRVALTNTTTVTVTTPVASEIVYNTTPNAFVSPGFYYLLTATGPWVRFGGTGWLTDGNAGTNATVNFIGTIDDVDVSFRRFNAPAGRLSTTSTSYGVGALNNTTAGNNTGFGNNALGTTTGIQNVAVGFSAMPVNGTGSANVAIGYQSLLSNTNSLRNTAIGWRSMATLNSSAATDNVAIGWQSMQDVPASTAITYGTFIGAQSGRNTRGTNNTGIGRQALGSNNGLATTGIDNTAVGHQALSFTSSGQQNTGIGAESLYRVTTGSTNSALGFRSGGNITTGSNNITIGHLVQVPSATGSNQIVIGAGVAGTAYVNAPSWLTSSDRRLKTDIKDSPLGLDFIKTIRPVSYSRIDNENKETEFGFIAQELQAALSNAGIDNHGIVSKTANGMFAVRYNDFLPMTVKAVQEQQVLIEKLQKDNEELKATNATILKRLDALEKRQ